MMHPAAMTFACLLSMLPGPPGIEFENSYLSMLPVDKTKCPYIKPEKDIIFRLYTKYNPTVYQELVIGDDQALASTHIDFKDHTIVYFHAFLASPDSEAGTQIREGYTYRGGVNVIMVDAQRLEAGPWYPTAAENTWYIGQYTSRLVDYLVTRGLDLSNTHFIGHSLGAQSAGICGGALTTGKVNRITGLDPAAPLFTKLPLEHRLDKGDAHFVDIIHTDAGIFGMHNPMGHADFYPNGGISPQPGCELEVLWPRGQILEKFFCSHWRSYQYFAESIIQPHSFLSTSCPSWHEYRHGLCRGRPVTNMGIAANPQYSKQSAKTKKYKKKLSTTLEDENILASAIHNVYTKEIRNSINSNTNKLLFKISDTPNIYTTTEKVTYTNTDKTEASQLVNFMQEPILDLEMSYQNPKPVVLVPENDKSLSLSDKTHMLKKYKSIPSITDQIQKSAAIFKNKPLDANKHDTINLPIPNPKLYLLTDQGFNTAANNQNDPIKQTSQETALPVNNIQQIPNDSTLPPKTQHKRERRSLFGRQNNEEDNNMLFNILKFLIQNRKNVIPVVSVMREITTLVRSANGELNHSSKERNNYIGTPPPNAVPVTFNLALGKDPPMRAFFKKILGIGSPTEQLSINGVPGK